MTTIGIAVVEHAGRFLVGIRPEGAPLAGYAEFPGGKCEPGESPEDCAVRECAEEAGIDALPVRLLDCRTWDYPHGRVELHFWLCEPAGTAHPAPPFGWLSREELARSRFPEANEAVVAALIEAGSTP